MRIPVRVMPRAKQRTIGKTPDGILLVKVSEPAEGGRANAAVIETLAKHFGVPKRSVAIVRGLTSRQKLVEISSNAP